MEVTNTHMKQKLKNKASSFKDKFQSKKIEKHNQVFAMTEHLEGKKVAGQVSLSRLQAYVIAFVTIGVAGTVGLDIMSSVKSNINDTEAETGATNAIDGMNELLGFLPVIGLVVAAAVVIGLVSGFGRGGMRGRA